ncbi:hypothetical protein M2352_003526 [Azospirillum fermentarium]|uniref:hypothetical protein n=1 Tax=Azospirillum fermentarium TaxID=1233114 RepID=UPI002226C68E|nr:hypothetical protein [Azospirillum fermentarium]MCW2247892.1 hypothetical protein [Azospirillum fermentarium]
MADDGLAGVNQMVSDLNKSIKAAVDRAKAQASEPTANAQEFRKDVKKSTVNTPGFATDIGVLAKNTTRLNVVSSLAPNDPVDFYKFRVTTKGEPTLGKVGDDGVRVQLMSKLGVVVADSNKDAGDKFDNFDKLQKGEMTLDRGDYTLRVTREKGEKASDPKNYALQLSMGNYSQDFDTVAKQPAKGDSPFSLSGAQQAMLSGMTDALSNMQSMPSGQTGTQKLMGSFNLFV